MLEKEKLQQGAEFMTRNRLLRGECLRCGTPLIADFMGSFNEYNCCTACTDFVEKSLYELSKKKKPGSIKVGIPMKDRVFVKNSYREAE